MIIIMFNKINSDDISNKLHTFVYKTKMICEIICNYKYCLLNYILIKLCISS